ncbi:Hypothetical predicted protein [Paramuricea clavata]|uniref:Reverse transcriptase domain-containing protein n=1 Tax=Paramuricea clavata TaxID=317549 RepID=A0A6S7JYN8_PARCT|nr:Hypothetical predicted protein [Paramuricea clavata]
MLSAIGMDLSKNELNSFQSKQLEELILSYSDIVSKNKRDLGKYKLGVKHRIHLKQEAVPVKQPLRRIPFGYQEEVRNYLKTMLNNGVIEKSSSEWANMTSGYYQVEIADEDKDKTAFTSPYGLYQYCRMPFGLAGASGTFQSVIEDMVQVLDTEDMIAYLDDVICFHRTFEEHLEGISRLFQMIRDSGFKLSCKKCQFATSSVKFLGHVIDKSGV